MTKSKKPTGREEVMQAVLDAAESLFAKHGVRAVSFRDIAARANINHGLIHRHFGSKENLRRSVQDRLSQRIRAEIGTPRDVADGFQRGLFSLQKEKTYWKLMARTMLDGDLQGSIQSEFPYVRRMIELVAEAQQEGRVKDDLSPQEIVAGAFAMGLGLLLFEQYILPGVGLEQSPAEKTIRRITAAWLDLLNIAAAGK